MNIGGSGLQMKNTSMYNILQWVLTILCAIIGFSYVSQSAATFLFAISLAFTISPLLWKILYKKNIIIKFPVRIAVWIILFMALIFSVPKDGTNKESKTEKYVQSETI